MWDKNGWTFKKLSNIVANVYWWVPANNFMYLPGTKSLYHLITVFYNFDKPIERTDDQLKLEEK